LAAVRLALPSHEGDHMSSLKLAMMFLKLSPELVDRPGNVAVVSHVMKAPPTGRKFSR
jgi:hypothetical protein